MLIARVLPDIRAIDKTFDYLVPDTMVDHVRVGTLVRVRLHGRPVGGWVVALTERPATERALLPLAKVTGWGPGPELVDLSEWAAWRWAGRRSHFLTTASAPYAVPRLPPPALPVAARDPGPDPAAPDGAGHDDDVARLAANAMAAPGGRAVLRLAPAIDPFPALLVAAARGSAAVLTPSVDGAVDLGHRLRRAGVPVAVVPRDWARAAAGGCTVVGSRAAAWAPVPDLAAVVVLDAHDEGYASEAAPTWNARDVAAERARRAGVPCVLVSPCPPVDLDGFGPEVVASRTGERAGWPPLDLVDRTRDDPRTGLFSERLVALLRAGGEGRLLCVLNRKGRARLLACGSCGNLARCERCQASVEQAEGGLRCRRCGLERPMVCATCGAQRLKTLRAGVTRVREELEALAGRPVGEVTGDTEDLPAHDVLVGTEAVLHRVSGPVRAVAFLDFDQELLAPRYRAGEEAMALLVRAARLVGGRSAGGRVLVQTRLARHEVLQAALLADPARATAAERPRRALLRFPPASAIAVVSGPPAEAFVDGLAGRGLEILGAGDGRWLVRGTDHRQLCDALAASTRPPGRLRVEVDPLRL